MIPGLSNTIANRLESQLEPRVTDVTVQGLVDLPLTLFGSRDGELQKLGIITTGRGELTVVVTDPDRPIGRLTIDVMSDGCLLFIDNRAAEGNLHGNIRMLGPDCAVIFAALDDGYIALQELFMRSAGQLLFWGRGANAVGCSIEMEGDDRSVIIGDDALISSGIWIRNHDMHAVHDLRSGARINRPPVDTVLERHVWVAQNALLLNCQRVGLGSIVGAQSLVKGVIGECVAVGGAPARVIRYQVSWGRNSTGMTEIEREMVGMKPET